MFEKRFYYVITFQYLGYRFHGWQKQPNLKTVHLMIDRTLKYILKDTKFKTLASSRTDAMVSANAAAFELFIAKKIEDTKEFLAWFNYNLPQDIRALSIQAVTKNFNIIQDVLEKEYLYLFSEGTKNHPFCAPLIATFLDALNIAIMQEGAKLFEGKHNFKSYCYKASENGNYTRKLTLCELLENTEYTANFFPEKSYLLRVKGKGFGRNQIRLIMGALVKLGKGEITLDFIKKSLAENSSTTHIDYMAPASGLILNKITFR